MFLILSLVSTYVNKNRFFIIHRTLYIRLHDGGYWAADGSYNGGETRCCRVDFENPNLKMLLDMLSSGGFPENMSKLSYFPSGIVDQNKKDLCSHIDVAEMLTFSSELESMNLYVVRADDPFLDDVLAYFKILKRGFITIYKFYETFFRKTEFGKFSRNNLIGKSMR